jgi:hypothetical protein
MRHNLLGESMNRHLCFVHSDKQNRLPNGGQMAFFSYCIAKLFRPLVEGLFFA